MTAEREERVREHLQPGEQFRAAVWVSRPSGRSSTGMSRAELSTFRFRRSPTSDRHAPAGPGSTLAEKLHEHIRLVTEPRLLALTDRRLLVLSKRPGSWRDPFRPSSRPLPPLHLRWECPRPELASATDQDGRLHLAFTDGSTSLLLTPSAELQPFLEA